MVHGSILLVEGGESGADCEEGRAGMVNKPMLVFAVVIVQSVGVYVTGREICVQGRAAMVGAS
jgi:hypothetical protein